MTVKFSPHIRIFYNDFVLPVVLDSGKEANLISYSAVAKLQIPLACSTRVAWQADGIGSLEVLV